MTCKHRWQIFQRFWIVEANLEDMPTFETVQGLPGFSHRDGAAESTHVKTVGGRVRLTTALHGAPWSQRDLKDCNRRPYEAPP